MAGIILLFPVTDNIYCSLFPQININLPLYNNRTIKDNIMHNIKDNINDNSKDIFKDN